MEDASRLRWLANFCVSLMQNEIIDNAPLVNPFTELLLKGRGDIDSLEIIARESVGTKKRKNEDNNAGSSKKQKIVA